jgi:hypothetical protein
MTVDSQPFSAAAKRPHDPHIDDDETTIATPPLKETKRFETTKE